MNNYFLTSAQKAKREQNSIAQKKDTWEELKAINVLIPASLHHAVQLHRVETGENMTQLIRRLLQEELLP